MKKLLYSIIVMLCLVSCKKTLCDINILTDDLLMYDIVDRFNAVTAQNKVNITYLKTQDETVFERYGQMKPDNVDLIIGSYNVLDDFDFKYLQKIPKEPQDLTADTYINRAYKSSFGYYLPYALDFHVLTTLRTTKVTENGKTVSAEDIQRFLNTHLGKNKIIFSPSLSPLTELEYLFLFGCKIESDNQIYSFDSEYTNSCYSKYINFDKNYNISEEQKDKIIAGYVNIPRLYYLKKKILMFDIMPLSQALLLDKNLYEFYYFSGYGSTTFQKKVIAMTKSNINPELSKAFIDFILSKDTQDRLYNQTVTENFNRLPVNVPIYLDATDDTDGYDENIINITKKISEPDFVNETTYHKFIEAYKFTKTLISNGQIDKTEFLKSITKNIN